MKLSALTVRQRLLAGYAVAVVFILLVAGVGLWTAERTRATTNDLYYARTEPMSDLGEIQYLITRNRVLVMDGALNPTPENIKKRAGELDKNQEKITEDWKRYMSSRMDAEEAGLAAELEKTRAAFRDEGVRPAMAALVANDIEKAKALIAGPVSKLAPAYTEVMGRMMDYQIRAAKKELTTAEQMASMARWISIGLLAAAVVASSLLAVLISGGIQRALGAEPGDLADAAERIARGELKDDGRPAALPGSVMASMQTMRHSLADVVSTVRGGVESVATASAQIAQGNLDLSSRTESQASSLQQTAAAMEELTGTVANSAENARQASQLAVNASDVAQRGGEKVSQVVTTMQEIQASSRKISDITSVIDGIAFQTNILALNAAVEAARAGEQGRGFAVVAGEVRTLAQRSAEAAREIKTLIGESVDRVEAGGALVADAGETMQRIVDEVRRVSDLVSEITAAANEQTQGITQVGQAVTTLDQATQQNAALVEESAAAADSLKSQASKLAEAVAVFKLA